MKRGICMKLEVVKGSGRIKKAVSLFPTHTKGLLKVQSGWSPMKKMKLLNVSWEEKQTRSVGKSAVGAVAGGLLAGPVGLLAGAALGAKRKEVSAAVLTFEDAEIIVRMTAKEYETVCSWVD